MIIYHHAISTSCQETIIETAHKKGRRGESTAVVWVTKPAGSYVLESAELQGQDVLHTEPSKETTFVTSLRIFPPSGLVNLPTRTPHNTNIIPECIFFSLILP